jgi:hypothetical protein
VYAGGGSEGKNKPEDYSNNAVIAVDFPKSKYVCLFYREESSLKMDFIEYNKEEGNTIKLSNRKTLTVNGITIGQSYKLGKVGETVFVHSGETLSQIDIPKKEVLKERDSIEHPEEGKINDNVSNTVFYDNRCFYIDGDGSVFIYNKEEKSFHKYENISLPAGAGNISIVKTEKIKRAAGKRPEEWRSDFFQKIIKDEEYKTSKADEDILRRYFEFKKPANDSENTEKSGCKNFNDWYTGFFKDEYQKTKERKEEQKRQFLEKWKIGPDTPLFQGSFEGSFVVQKEKSINEGKDLYEKDYRGPNTDLKGLIEYNNKILETYKKIKNYISQDTVKLFEGNYKVVVSEISRIMEGEKGKFDKDKREYSAEIKRLDGIFTKTIQENFDALELSYDAGDVDFDYVFLPAWNGNPEYTVIYKKIMPNNRINASINAFAGIGNDIKLTGVYNDLIYSCENGGINFYDPFTLKNKEIKRENSKNSENETILFSLDTEENIFVTEREIRNKKNYYVRQLEIDHKTKTYKLSAPKNSVTVSGNTISNGGGYSDIFFASILGKAVYINSRNQKRPRQQPVVSKEGYIYWESSIGAGVKIPNTTNSGSKP